MIDLFLTKTKYFPRLFLSNWEYEQRKPTEHNIKPKIFKNDSVTRSDEIFCAEWCYSSMWRHSISFPTSTQLL